MTENPTKRLLVVNPRGFCAGVERAIDVVEGEGPEDALRAFKALDRRLAEDNATGHLYQGDGAEIIHFPGCEKANV